MVSNLSRLFPWRNEKILMVQSAAVVHPGDRVLVEVSVAGILRNASVTYLVPLLALIVTAMAGRGLAIAIGAPEIDYYSCVGGVLGFAIALTAMFRPRRDFQTDSPDIYIAGLLTNSTKKIRNCK
jgi:positive regulator of sigma E activity